MTDFIKQLLMIITPIIIGGFSGWFFTKRKYVAEAESNEIDNVEKAVAIWRNLAQNLKAEIDEVIENQKKLMVENGKLIEEISKLKLNLQKVIRENKDFRKELEKQKNEI